MDWPTLFTSLGSAVIVAFLGPRFQHLVWKKQKLREQRLSVAERFDVMNRNFWLVTNVMPPDRENEHGEQLAAVYSVVKQLIDPPPKPKRRMGFSDPDEPNETET